MGAAFVDREPLGPERLTHQFPVPKQLNGSELNCPAETDPTLLGQNE